MSDDELRRALNRDALNRDALNRDALLTEAGRQLLADLPEYSRTIRLVENQARAQGAAHQASEAAVARRHLDAEIAGLRQAVSDINGAWNGALARAEVAEAALAARSEPRGEGLREDDDECLDGVEPDDDGLLTPQWNCRLGCKWPHPRAATPPVPALHGVDLFATQLQETGHVVGHRGDEQAIAVAIDAIGIERFEVTATPSTPAEPRGEGLREAVYALPEHHPTNGLPETAQCVLRGGVLDLLDAVPAPLNMAQMRRDIQDAIDHAERGTRVEGLRWMLDLLAAYSAALAPERQETEPEPMTPWDNPVLVPERQK